MSKRDVAPIFKLVRNFLLGREHKTALRFQPDISTRSPDPPNLPEGPYHKLCANYYYPRDARREVLPPVILGGGASQIAAPVEETPKLPAGKTKTPGKPYAWD